MAGHVRYLLAGALACGFWVLSTSEACSSPPPDLFRKGEAKRLPKAATYVAWAVCQERQAESTGLNSSQKQNLLDCARETYQKAIEVDPGHLPAYVGLARVYTNMNRSPMAVQTYQRALQKAPRDASLWLYLGMCHCKSKQWEPAIRSFEKARELDPENRAINQTLGLCQARAGLVQDALQSLGRVMTPAEAHYTVARMMQHIQRDDLCRQLLAYALQLNPELAAARDLQMKLDRPQNAGAQQTN